MKKIMMCLLLAVVLTAPAALFAAGSQDTAAARQTEKVTINVWTLWTESSQDVNAKVFHRVFEEAKLEFPEIEFRHDATENEAYKTKIKTAIAANEAPDVFFSWGAGFVKPFVDAGKVLALDGYLTDGTADKMNPGSATFFTFNGKIYGLPAYQWVGVLYCNTELFQKYGVKIPETNAELIAAVRTFRANGISPIAVGEKDRWPGMFWQNAFALRTAGAALCQEALSGTASFDRPEFVESAARLAELVSLDAFIDGAMGLSYDEAMAAFLEGQVPMTYMGNWFAGNIVDSKVNGKVVVRNFPALPGAKGAASEFLGGSIDGLCVSEQSEHRDEAVKFVKFVAERMAQELAATGDGLPTWKVPEATGEINPITKQIVALSKDATGFVLAWDTFLEGADAQEHLNLVAEIYGEKLSPADFAKEMQKLNEN